MTRIVNNLVEVSSSYDALFVDVWGCLHDGFRPFPDAVRALQRYREAGGKVVLVTNSPRPWPDVERQLRKIGVPESCWDVIATSGDSARMAMFHGVVGRNVYHIGPPHDLVFFNEMKLIDDALDIRRVPLEEAEGIVCTGLFMDETDMPEDYRAQLLYARTSGLKLLCANPDIVVDRGERRVYCAGAIAALYAEMGGECLYFGKPYPPIYDLARRRLATLGSPIPDDRVMAVGDGIQTDIKGALIAGIDSLFITGGLAAEKTATKVHPDERLLNALIEEEKATPTFAIGFLR